MPRNYKLLAAASFVILSLLACSIQSGVPQTATATAPATAVPGTTSTEQGSLLPATATQPPTSTVVLSPTPTVVPSPTVPPVQSPTAICDQAAFVSETIPDGTTFAPGASFVKSWRLKNTGACTWTSSYALVFVSGSQLGAPASVSFSGNVAPGQEVDLMVNMTAPGTPASYTSNWELRNDAGVLFGLGPSNGIFWAKITVLAPTSTPAPATAGAMFVQVASAANIVGDSTYIDDPRTNNQPNLILFITQNWNPGGGTGTYNKASVGVWYDTSVHKWAIFNEDQSSMPVNAAFNVWIPSSGASLLLQTATGSNTNQNYTLINDARTNNQPNLVLMITQNWNPGGGAGKYNPPSVGVWYDSVFHEWSIFNEDRSAMPLNAAFNVLIFSPATTSFLQTATGTNTASNYTLIDNAATNDNPGSILFVTQDWNPGGGVSGIYNPASIGVWYDSPLHKWSVFNEDHSSMPANSAYEITLSN